MKHSDVYRAVVELSTRFPNGVTEIQVASCLGYPEDHEDNFTKVEISRKIFDLGQMGVLVVEGVTKGKGGVKAYVYVLEDSKKLLLEEQPDDSKT